MEVQKVILKQDHRKQPKSNLKRRTTSFYYIQCKQFIIVDGCTPSLQDISQIWDVSPNQDLIGDIDTIIEGIKRFHAANQPIKELTLEKHPKSKMKRVRFQLPVTNVNAKHVSYDMPDVMQHRCNNYQKQYQSIIKAQAEEDTRTLRRHKAFKYIAFPMIKYRLKSWFYGSMKQDERSPIMKTVGIKSAKDIARLNTYSYCRHKDAMLLDEWEKEAVDVL